MKKKSEKSFKKGAASFYMVAFSTLILLVIATSFAAVIISEVTRSGNDDLAQSAYDSALAGVEDAKLAYYNYLSCIRDKDVHTEQTPDGMSPVTCGEILYYINNPNCDMVGHILGRIGENAEGSDVMIRETRDGDNELLQAYTCVEIQTTLKDYRGTLTDTDPMRVVQAKFSGIDANRIERVKVSWFSDVDGSSLLDGGNYANFRSSRVTFPIPSSTSKISAPPTIAVGLVQTADRFTLEEFDETRDGQTNRGMVYLVPTENASRAAGKNTPDNYIGVYDSGYNKITADQIVKSNDQTVKNLPYVVYCPLDSGSEFVCSATLELPKAINGGRSNESFVMTVMLPYGQPNTHFALEFCTVDGECTTRYDGSGSVTVSSDAVELENMQVSIDSTGRANDLYRRIEARLDTADVYYPYLMYALELFGDSGAYSLKKDFTVTCENNFGIDDSFVSNCR